LYTRVVLLRRLSALVVAVSVVLPARSTTAQRTASALPVPKLAVILVVDQMRADYVDRFQKDWNAGLKRLVAQGAWFNRAAYPYLNTYTCAGHATIGTGTFPNVHGIIQNTWWDRDAGAVVSCSADPDAHAVVYGRGEGTGESARRLEVPTYADLMRTERNAHVVALSLKERSAIMLAGHGADAALWMDGTEWATSSVYSTAPVPAVKAFLDAHPLTADAGKSWNRLLPPGSYPESDDDPTEKPPAGWTRTFPHALKTVGAAIDQTFLSQWERSPFADAYLGQLASALVRSMELGKHGGTDVLAISFSTPDLIGHAFGPDSQEVEDAYAHLDRTLGLLFDTLDSGVGRDQYVVTLSADHGVTPNPDRAKAASRDAGQLSSVTLAALINTRAQAALGDGRYVARLNGNDVYFEPGMYDKLSANPQAMRLVIDALVATPGIAAAFPSERVRGGASSRDPLLKSAALSYFPGRSGDILVIPKPGWIFTLSGASTTHGTASADDQRVPILFYGHRIKPGIYPHPATPADIAPTLAAITGATMPGVSGHILTSVIQR
jgi:predicted AlkP superfamily pyrophosphatase or phosphodiesterase